MPYHPGFNLVGLAEDLHQMSIPVEDPQQIAFLEHQMLVECARLEVEQARVRELARIREALETIGVRQELLIGIQHKGKR